MTSKERAKLKSIASNMDAILQIGKNPIGDTFVKQVSDALRSRELIKINVLETCELTPYETAEALSELVHCEVVQVIGRKVILFMRRPKGDKKASYLDEKKAEKTSKNSSVTDKKRKAYQSAVKKFPQKNDKNKSLHYRYSAGGKGRVKTK